MILFIGTFGLKITHEQLMRLLSELNQDGELTTMVRALHIRGHLVHFLFGDEKAHDFIPTVTQSARMVSLLAATEMFKVERKNPLYNLYACPQQINIESQLLLGLLDDDWGKNPAFLAAFPHFAETKNLLTQLAKVDQDTKRKAEAWLAEQKATAENLAKLMRILFS